MLVEWGVDYLKYDNCFPRMVNPTFKVLYTKQKNQQWGWFVHIFFGQDGSTNVEEAYIDFAASAEHFPSIWQVNWCHNTLHLTIGNFKNIVGSRRYIM